jgi:hypothetical protein
VDYLTNQCTVADVCTVPSCWGHLNTHMRCMTRCELAAELRPLCCALNMYSKIPRELFCTNCRARVLQPWCPPALSGHQLQHLVRPSSYRTGKTTVDVCRSDRPLCVLEFSFCASMTVSRLQVFVHHCFDIASRQKLAVR